MELRHLRYFVVVVREANFTRAAELLHVAQPPLSRQIQQLEDELGVPLLLRSRPLRLTDAGRVFYEQARQILNRVEQMESATRRVGKSKRSVLSIGFVPSMLSAGLPSLVRRLREHDPDLDLQLIELMSVQQPEALTSGRIDIGFGRIRTSDPGIERLVLREERLVAAIPFSSPIALKQRRFSIRSIADQSLIVYPRTPRPSFADHVLSILSDHGVHPKTVYEVTDLQTALGLVAADQGICIAPESTRIFRSDLQYRVLDDKYATSPIILSHRLDDKSPYINLTKELAVEMFAEEPSKLRVQRSR
jgi:LysR family transcriptional regulator, benzoate and cis,cis-muconate-responsive activator of ben and cat genes